MNSASQAASKRWTIFQAMTLAGACLIAGTAAGWLLRAQQSPAVDGVAQASAAAVSQMPESQLKSLADTNAAPLLRKLQSDPNNPDLLISVGNLYYDARQYQVAIGYYGRALQVKPADVSVRTDMGTAYWYMGDADAAIAAFNRALADAPNNPNTLFNLGIVEWQGKMDVPAAVSAWKELLAANPGYQGRAQVEQLIAQAAQQTPSPQGSPAK
ncbi:MAG TPA: tetratricopeptide repeat protein [Acidobacteriaceae bacterium]|nr:tetratricopeptide repeat protein [Acidobacteriaceae bacterium]